MNISVGLSFLTNTILAHTKKIKIEITIYTVSVCMGWYSWLILAYFFYFFETGYHTDHIGLESVM